MDLFTQTELKKLLTERETPCVSLFMPTHRGGKEQDPIRFRVHLEEAEKRLVATGLRAPEARKMLEPARQLLEDAPFWRHQSDGLAAFLTPETLRLYRLPLAFDDLVLVGDRFQVRPLLPLLSSDGRFFVLALSQNAVRLYQGTRYSISEVALKETPRNLAEAMRTHDRDEPLTFHTRPTSGGTWGAIFQGHGVGIDDAKDDLLRYFQQIDRGLHGVLRGEQAPLVLAAVDYLLPIYRQANTYAHLLPVGFEGNPDRLSSKELHDGVWALVEPFFERAQEQAVAQYRQLAGTGRTAHEFSEVLPAAYEGQLETLFVARGRPCWGSFDPVTGQVEQHDREEPGDEDLVNLAVVHTLLHGRIVHAVAAEKVPEGGLVAAMFCLPLAKRGKRP